MHFLILQKFVRDLLKIVFYWCCRYLDLRQVFYYLSATAEDDLTKAGNWTAAKKFTYIWTEANQGEL